jgi:hypothetical protein
MAGSLRIGVEKIEMKIGELLKIALAVVEYVIEIPDLEAVAHADEEDMPRLTAPLIEPRRDWQAALVVDSGRGSEAEVATQPIERVRRIRERTDDLIAGASLDPLVHHDMIEHDKTVQLIVQADMQCVLRAPRRDRADERLRQQDDTAICDLADRTPYKQSTHVRSPRLLSPV